MTEDTKTQAELRLADGEDAGTFESTESGWKVGW